MSPRDQAPQLISDGETYWILTWHGRVSGSSIGNVPLDAMLVESTDDGDTWTAPRKLSVRAQLSHIDFSPRLATDRAGHWLAVWHARDDAGGTATGRDLDILVSIGGPSAKPPGPPPAPVPECTMASDCNDGAPCTLDVCESATCSSTNLADCTDTDRTPGGSPDLADQGCGCAALTTTSSRPGLFWSILIAALCLRRRPTRVNPVADAQVHT